jgi:hypothetical protein
MGRTAQLSNWLIAGSFLDLPRCFCKQNQNLLDLERAIGQVSSPFAQPKSQETVPSIEGYDDIDKRSITFLY